MSKNLSHLLPLFVFLLMQAGFSFAFAQTATDMNFNFDSRVYFSSGTALWNQTLQVVQPTNIVKDWNAGSGNNTSTIDVGDGSDGAFKSTTWSKFGTVDSTNKIIYFDNSAHSTLNATTFTLDAGWTLIPTASQSLKIYVQGDAAIDGVINCSGNDGGSVTAVPGVPGASGTGRCGGGDGGDGGAQRTGTGSGAWNGGNGSSPTASTTITGGNGGAITNGTAGAGGGGGGSFGDPTSGTPTAAANGGNGTATAGARGSNHDDPSFQTVAGGAGGGGGSGSSTQAGGGGGGGGGVIILHVAGDLTFGVNGAVTAKGGNGGLASSDGGEGGSGGGGSIQTWVGKGLHMQSTNNSFYSINAEAGANSSGSASRGGNGWPGRTWSSYDTVTGFDSTIPGIDPTESNSMLSTGSSYYTSSSSQDVVSAAVDTKSTMAIFNSAGFTSTNDPDVTLELAGSNDAFASDDTGWIATTAISTLNNKRYIRFRLSINNSSATTPTTVSQVTVNYTPGLRTDFDFTSAGGCGQVSDVKKGPPPWTGMFLLLPFLAFVGIRRRSKVRSKK